MNHRVKLFVRVLAATIILFIVISLTSFFALADGHGVVRWIDGITRVGWPMLMYEEGGYVHRQNFYLKAAIVDLGVAALIAIIAVWVWNETIGSDSNKALQANQTMRD
jgi:hypothetical protein